MKMLHQHGGYSLIELLVTVAIFSLAFTVIGSAFLSFSLAQGQANTRQRMLNEGNFMLEAMARDIRMNTIDYQCPGVDYALDHSMVCLRSIDGKVVRFRYDATPPASVKVCKRTVPADCDDANNWTVLNPDFVSVISLQFHVYPTVNPQTVVTDPVNDQTFNFTYQPMTIITLRIQAGIGRSRNEYALQTTVSSRAYSN